MSRFISTGAVADIRAMDPARWTVQRFAYGKLQHFVVQSLPISERIMQLGRFTGLAVCLPGRSNVKMKIGVQHWWSDGDRGSA